MPLLVYGGYFIRIGLLPSALTIIGGSDWIRTSDQRLMSPLLYRLSYAAVRRIIVSALADVNFVLHAKHTSYN